MATKWEYTARWSTADHFDETLNVLGDKGWELVSVDGTRAYFKRPSKQDEDKGKELHAKMMGALDDINKTMDEMPPLPTLPPKPRRSDPNEGIA